uniref:Uncharacterized protein n=1 Tax=Lactuca sativa TaxID=4236 RepID=A0A9R1VI12_LACSA|nr:hypothetical protein LSAT_V11C500298180 [Lactuca sativa]
MIICIIFQNLKSIVDIDFNVESSINTTRLNTEIEIGLSIIATIIGFNLEEGWYSFYCHDCSKKITKNGDDSDGEPFNFNGCGGVYDVFNK